MFSVRGFVLDRRGGQPHLPVLGLQLQHHGVLRLADVALVAILDLLGILLRLDAVVLGKGAVVARAARVGEEVRPDGLNAALRGARELADGLEVLVAAPARGQDGEGDGDLRSRRHGCVCGALQELQFKINFFFLGENFGGVRCKPPGGARAARTTAELGSAVVQLRL